jgi:hypothetical protein
MKRRPMRAGRLLTLMIILFALSVPVETKETGDTERFGKVFINLDAMEKKQNSIKMNLRFVETYHLDLETHMVRYMVAIMKNNEQRKGESKSEIIRVWQNCLAKHQGIEELYREWMQLRIELEKEVNISLGKL